MTLSNPKTLWHLAYRAARLRQQALTTGHTYTVLEWPEHPLGQLIQQATHCLAWAGHHDC
jgi:hypothetical protein